MQKRCIILFAKGKAMMNKIGLFSLLFLVIVLHNEAYGMKGDTNKKVPKVKVKPKPVPQFKRTNKDNEAADILVNLSLSAEKEKK